MTGLDVLAVQLHQAERAVHAHPGQTVHEIANAICCPDVPMLRERFVELERVSKIHRGPGLNRCRITGKTASAWFPGADPSDLAAGYAQAMDTLAPPHDPTTAADAA